jgi:hypothetical protein
MPTEDIGADRDVFGGSQRLWGPALLFAAPRVNILARATPVILVMLILHVSRGVSSVLGDSFTSAALLQGRS